MQHICKNPRYNISVRLDRLPYSQRQRIVRLIRKDLNIPRSTWSRWMRIPDSSRGDIPGRALVTIARHLQVQPAELFNDQKQEA